MTVREAKEMSNEELILALAIKYEGTQIVRGLLTRSKKDQRDAEIVYKELAQRGIIADIEWFMTEWNK